MTWRQVLIRNAPIWFLYPQRRVVTLNGEWRRYLFQLCVCVCVCVFQRKVCACLWVLVGAQHLVAITFLSGEEYFSQNRKCCHHLLKCNSIPIWLTWSTKGHFVVHPSCSFPCNESKWVWLSLLSFKILPESTINIFVFRKHDEDMKYRSSLTVFHKSDKQVWNDTRVRK